MIIKAKMLTCCKGWVKVNLDSNDFKFITDYSPSCNFTQVWKSKSGEIFILRDVKIIKEVLK